MNASRRLVAFPVTVVLILSGCGYVGDSDANTYTLYRQSAAGGDARVHMATFDADEREAYNRDNCDIAARLFMAQPGVSVKYWCEKGRYRP